MSPDRSEQDGSAVDVAAHPAGAGAEATGRARLRAEVSRRRTFAIISHPDAGKTTLTEKLLLYGGAIHLAGSVKARRAARHATSDWMEMEQERGISITSSVLQFDYDGFRINLLDTPGHQDFSEDTYRTLVAADSAVMLLDNRKGVEEQTRKLFAVCKRRRVPIVTFVNKCDRAGEDPLKLIDDVERDLGIAVYPMTWPILRGDEFLGVFDRVARRIHLFERGQDHGQRRAGEEVRGLEDASVARLIGPEAHARLLEEIALLDAVGAGFDAAAFHRGEVTPTFFGSALTNFGVEPFLRAFLGLAPEPAPRETEQGGAICPDQAAFTGFVFKIQANMDPKHRDRIAFVRICSGAYEPGMTVKNVRTERDIRLAAPTQFLARERTLVEEAWAGDVVGIHDRGSLRIGDTLSADGPISFAGIPRFSPEHFASVSVPDPLRRKHLDTGLRQLSEEGAVQVFYEEGLTGPAPILGAVGLLQFDVLVHRLEHEYGVVARLHRLAYVAARWVEGDPRQIRELARGYGRALVHDAKERPLFLFESEWSLRETLRKPEGLTFHDVAP
ncbi:MAG TPA: peptide chain release factor 3 [Longimicrobiales bacterium]|nr:peptide chain release factor 3 [Longimicrobiales bacterium]